MNEQKWDKYLKINTIGRQDAHADEYHYPYEPTPYVVLERLAESGYITSESEVIDYGCGKGRVGFFLNRELGCKVTGIEYNEDIYKEAYQNLATFFRSKKSKGDNGSGTNEHIGSKKSNGCSVNEEVQVQFVCTNAENYQIEEEDCFYFFNPFSVEILQSVIGRIVDSYYDYPREMRLFFYYPSDEYMAYLMTKDELMFVDEIDYRDLFDERDERERIVIFEVEG